MPPDQTKIDPTGSDPSPAQPATKNLSAGEAAELMSTTVQRMREQWLQAAVTVANALKGGQTVHRGTFDDLRQLRESYEELERARMFLRNVGNSVEQPGATGEQANSE